MKRQPNTLRPGDAVVFYDDPLTEQIPCWKGILRACRSRDLGTWNGRELQCWQIQVGDEIHELKILAPATRPA